MIEIRCWTSSRETNSGWLLKIKQVSTSIPAIRIIQVFSVTIRIYSYWTILLEGSKKRRASWTTIEPNKNWIFYGIGRVIVFRLNEQVVKFFGFGGIQITRVSGGIDLDVVDAVGHLESR